MKSPPPPLRGLQRLSLPTIDEDSEQQATLPPPSYPEHIHSPRPSDSYGQDPRAHDDFTFDDDDDGNKAGLHPFLGLRARLCLSVLSPPLIALLFTGAHLLLNSSDIDDKVATAKTTLLSACHDAEHQASLAASLPHYLADSMNARTQDAIQGSVRSLGRVVILTLVALEALVTFFVNSYRSVFLCFIELLVRGSLSLLIAAVALMNTAVQDAGTGIKAAIQASIDGVNGFLSTSLDGINDVLSLVGKSIKVPQIAQPDLSALDNVQLPTSFEDALLKLNGTLPTLTEFKQKMDQIVQMPFEALKTDVNATTANYTFDATLLPLPAQQTITFCDELDTFPLDKLGHALKRLVFIGIIIIAAVILLLIVAGMMREWWSWRCLNRNLARTRRVWVQQGGAMDGAQMLRRDNLFNLLSMAHHPLLTGWALSGAAACGVKSSKGQRRVRWWASFVGHPTAIICLAIGLTGMVSVELQMLALRPIERHYQHQLDGSFNSFGDAALARINAVMANASYEYANRSNALILNAQNDLNDHLFGWVNTTTSTLNTTLNEFVDGISTALNDTFSGTPLYTPLQTFISCLLLQKVIDIEKALTWLQDNAHADFPTVSPTVLMLSPNRSQELVQPITQAADGGGDGNGSGGALGKVVNGYEEKLRKERLLFAIFLGLYAVVLIVGTAVAVLHPAGQNDGDESHDAPNSVHEKHGSAFIVDRDSAPPRSPPYTPYANANAAAPPTPDGTLPHQLATPVRLDDTTLEMSTTPMVTFARMHGNWHEEQRRRFEEQQEQERERGEEEDAWEDYLQSPVRSEGVAEQQQQQRSGPPRRTLLLPKAVSFEGTV